jgi:hypothetical protein
LPGRCLRGCRCRGHLRLRLELSATHPAPGRGSITVALPLGGVASKHHPPAALALPDSISSESEFVQTGMRQALPPSTGDGTVARHWPRARTSATPTPTEVEPYRAEHSDAAPLPGAPNAETGQNAPRDHGRQKTTSPAPVYGRSRLGPTRTMPRFKAAQDAGSSPRPRGNHS